MVTQSTIRDTVEDMIGSKDQDLCNCLEENVNVSQCRLLDSLSAQQRSFCHKVVRANFKLLLPLVKADSPIKIQWVTGPLNVKTPKQNERAVTAVANAKERSIVIDEERFRELDEFERVSLMTHELLHIIPRRKGQFDDDSPIGPFKEARQLLNAVGAAVVVWGINSGTFKRHDSRYGGISRAYRNHWLTLGVGQSFHDEEESKLLLSDDSRTESDFRYQYIPRDWGGTCGLGSTNTERISSGEYDVSHRSSYFYCGASYRFFPIDKPLSRLGQSFLQTTVAVEYGEHEIKISDDFVSIEDSAKSVGPALHVSYYFPLAWNIWLYGDYLLRVHEYKFEKLDADVKKMQQGYTIGAGYAFK
jgi:hypothetical protein